MFRCVGFKRRACVYLMLFLCVSQSFSQTVISPVSTGETQFITDEILRLEALRLVDPNSFNIGLNNLGAEQTNMSVYQYCHYSFLRAYQSAFRGESEAAIVAMKKLIPNCDDLRVKIRLNALVANISVIGGDYEKSSNHIDLSIQDAEQTTDLTSKALAYSAAVIVYNLLDQPELGVKYSELLYDLVPTEKNLCHLHYSSNVHHLDSNEPPIDFTKIKTMSEQCIKSGNLLYGQFLILDNIKWKLIKGQLDQASMRQIKNTLNSLNAAAFNSPYKNLQAIFAAVKAKFYWIEGDGAEAKRFALESIKLNQNLGNTEQLIMALEVLEKISSSRSNYLASYQYLTQKNKAEMNMYDESQAKQRAYMTVKHSNLAKVFEIEQLNRQKEVLELEKKLAKQEANNQRLLILLILTILGMLLLWTMKIKRRHDYFKDVSEIDHLTKVLTRKAFEEQINTVLSNTKSKNIAVFVAIMDLDFFKAVNDNHGHLIGDWVLKNVIYTCKELVEERMFIGRLGGEEFGIVMLGVDMGTMYQKVEAMRLAIEKLDTSASGVNLQVTASFGISNSLESGYDPAMLLTHADLALFKAKNKGRNQTVVYHEKMASD